MTLGADLLEILFVLSPLFIGGLLIVSIPRIKGLITWSGDLAPTFFLAVSLHFALFANLFASELWNNVVKANQSIRNEVNGLRSMMQIAEASLGDCSVAIVDSVKFYIDQVIKNEFRADDEIDVAAQIFPLSRMYRLLVVDPEFIPNETMRILFRDSLEQVRFNHYERLSLKAFHSKKNKLAALFIFGILTQISIAVYHGKSPQALKFTSLLFSICFSLTLMVLIVLDQPYRYPYLVSASAFSDVNTKSLHPKPLTEP